MHWCNIETVFFTDGDSVSLFKCSLSGDLVTTKHQV